MEEEYFHIFDRQHHLHLCQAQLDQSIFCMCNQSTNFSFQIKSILIKWLFVCLSATFSHTITFFCVTITQVLVQIYTTSGKQQWCSSSSIPTKTRWHLAPLKFLFIYILILRQIVEARRYYDQQYNRDLKVTTLRRAFFRVFQYKNRYK